MPQDIPLEASETLAFTPPSLSELDASPTFTLRAVTTRDKRFHRRTHIEQGVVSHSPGSIREEVMRGLKANWTPEQFDEHSPKIEAYWQAGDEHQKEVEAWEKSHPDAEDRKNNPAPEFAYDPEIEEVVKLLTRQVAQEWAPLRRMLADNAEFSEMSLPLMVAAVVKGYAGLDVPKRLDRGYLTVDCAGAIAEALGDMEEHNGLEVGTAWAELAVACTRRMYLTEEESGNSDVPSPSGTPPESSSETSDPGKSPASARSKKTRATA